MELHFTNLLIIVAAGFAVPFALGFFPGLRLPAIVFELVLGIIIGPIILALLFGFVNSNGTRDRIADSASAQFMSSYVVGDIQSADNLYLTPDNTTCSVINAATDTVTMRFTWDDPADSTVTTTVIYFKHSASGSVELWRSNCTTGQTKTTTLLVHYLQQGGTGANPNGPFRVYCDGSPCTSSTTSPILVKVQIDAFNKSSDASSYGAFTFEFQGRRRVTT